MLGIETSLGPKTWFGADGAEAYEGWLGAFGSFTPWEPNGLFGSTTAWGSDGSSHALTTLAAANAAAKLFIFLVSIFLRKVIFVYIIHFLLKYYQLYRF